MATITGGELIVKCLKKEGVKRIFAIIDAFYNPVIANVGKYDIRWIGPRHEAAAVHMAEGVFKTTGEIPVVMAGAGPGTANLLSGMICAREEGVPVVAISSQCRQEVIYPCKPGVFQGTEQYDFFKPVTKWNAVVHSWERIPEIIQRAFREAVSGRPGPVHVDVPYTVSYAEGEESKVRILEPHQYRATAPEPSEKQIEEVAKLIKGAKNPLLMAGTGVLNSGGWEDFMGLVELLNCPATTTMAARSAIPNDHSNYIFGYGKGALTARTEADVVLAVGTRLGDMDLPFKKYWGDPDKQKIIQVDIDPRNIGANWPIHMGVVGDAKAMVKALGGKLKEMGVKPSDGKMVKQYKDMDDEWWQEQTGHIKDYAGEKIHPAHSVQTARKVFPPDAINIGDGGNTSLFNAFFTPYTKPRTSLGLFEFGHLGIGIPYAIGAKVANPDKDVYVIVGDGAAGFNFMEMVTAVREKIKITVMVHAEESWCMEEIGQLMEFGDPSKLVGCKQYPIRWDKVAEGLGCYSEYVDKIENLEDAIRRAKDSELPAVLCVKTDKQSNLIPPGAEQFEQVYTGVPEEQG
ncbi:MAG: thiamine pyrophosphate-binding protein [Deltaproteobacteria bacterium]|uniref:Thiamine pyrophosphate-binding protein n=1 Tax=Candidatus Zymogenus saltonus TaxID=2844893 RepID=A0A9D8PN04_9DELT|nr:thiamine pyrophosphate-binding protein [Candidatus Zymogenus saltonus]